MAFVVFLIVKGVNALNDLTKKKVEEPAPAPAPAPTTKACPYCKSEIALDATRCPHCTSQLD
jgi:large conductance mechanosensitive channel